MVTLGISDSQKWFWFALALAAAWLLYLLAPILTPFAVALLLAYLGDPLVDRLERYRLSRTLAVVIVFTVMTLLLLAVPLLLVPLLEKQVTKLIVKAPEYWSRLNTMVFPFIEQRFGFKPDDYLSFDQIWAVVQDHWRSAGGIAATVVGYVSRSGLAVLGVVLNALLVPVVTFYLLRDWDVLMERISALIPRNAADTVLKLARESDAVLSAFLRGQLTVMVALGVIYSLGLTLVGIDLAFLIGMVAGMISFVPYLGGIVGVTAAIVAAIVQFGDVFHVAMVLLVFAVGQSLEGFVLTPWLVGERVGLHPVAVIFAIMAGGTLFGFLGVLLALPVASVLMVVLRHVHERYVGSSLYVEQKLKKKNA